MSELDFNKWGFDSKNQTPTYHRHKTKKSEEEAQLTQKPLTANDPLSSVNTDEASLSISPLIKHLGYGIICGSLIVGFLVYDALTTLPYFQISQVEFFHHKRLTEPELFNHLNLDSVNHNYFLVDLEMIRDRIITHPWIKDVTLTKNFPNQLQVFIRENQPVGVAVLDQLMAVDESGYPFAPVKAQEVIGLPLLSGVSPKFFKKGKAAHIGQRLLVRGLKIAHLYQESSLIKLKPLSGVYIAETGRVELMLNHTRVSLGQTNFSKRLAHLEQILKHIKNKGVDSSYILLSEDLNRAIVNEIPLKLENMEAINEHR